jgi:hypothetical protein
MKIRILKKLINTELKVKCPKAIPRSEKNIWTEIKQK